MGKQKLEMIRLCPSLRPSPRALKSLKLLHNEPALVDANAAEPADANEEALDHVDAKLIETEKADLAAASDEPAPAASILTSMIEAREVALRTISSLLLASISPFLFSEVLASTCFLSESWRGKASIFLLKHVHERSVHMNLHNTHGKMRMKTKQK